MKIYVIFTTFNNETDKLISKIGFLEKSFKNIKKDFINKQGLITSIFGNNISQNDIAAINSMNNAIKNGSTYAQAWCNYLTNCSAATKEQVKQCLLNKGSLDNLTNSLQANTVATKAATIATKALSIAGNMIAMWAISKGIQLVAKGIDTLTHSAEYCKERVDELMSSYNSVINTANSNAEIIKGLTNKYEELSKGVNNLGQNISLTTDEYSEYNDICNQIAEMFPNLVQGYTNEGNAILSLKGNVEALEDAYKSAQQEAYNMLIVSGKGADGNDIIKNWNNISDTKFFSSLFDFSADSIGKSISKTNAVKQLKTIANMTAEEYRNIARIVMYDSSKINSLTDIEHKVGESGYIQKTLGIDIFVSDEDFNNAKLQARTLIQTYQAEIDSALKNVQTLANAYLNTNVDFSSLDCDTQSAASIIINSLDEQIASSFTNKEGVGLYVDNIVQMLKTNPDVRNALVGLFSIDPTDIPVEDIKFLVDNYIDTIAKFLEKDPIEIKTMLEFDEIDDLSTKYENVIATFSNKFDDVTSDDLREFFAENLINTQEEIDKWIEVANSCRTAEEAKKKYLKIGIKDKTTISLSLSEEDSKTLDNYQANIKTITDSLSSLSEGALSASEQLDILQAIMEMDSAFDIEMYKNTNGTYDFKNALESLLFIITDKTAKAIPECAEYIRKIGNEAQGSVQGITDLSTAISNMESIQKLLQSVQDSISENQGRITPDILNDIVSKYGEMEHAVAAYNAGLITSQELYEQLQKCYETDWENFQIANQAKIYANTEYYNTTLQTESDRIKELSNSYGVDLRNYKSLAEAKAAIERKLLSTIGSAWSKYYDVVLGSNGIYKTVAKYNEDSYDAQNDPELIAMMDKANQLDLFYKKLANAFNIDSINFDDVKLDLKKSALSNSSKKDSDSEPNITIFDWIDKQIQSTNEEIDKLKTKLDSLENFQAKNIAIDDISIQYNNQLKLLEQAKEKYIEYANAVGLSSDYIEKIQNGSLEIEQLNGDNDKTLIKQIQDYQEWYDKAMNVEEQMKNIIETKKELMEQKPNNFINDIEDSIDKLNTSMDSVSDYASQNILVDKIIDLYGKEITSLEQLKEQYYQLADPIGLSVYYIEEIKNETFDMESITDTTIRKKIIQYLEWYKKGKDVEQTIEKTTQSIKELNRQKLDNLINDFERVTSLIKAYQDYYQALIDVKEAKGLMANEIDYNNLIQKELDKQATLQEQYTKMEQQFKASGLTPNDDEWYDHKKELLSLKTQIENCTVSVEKFKDAILELRWDNFEKGIDMLSNLDDEINDVSTLLGDGSLFKNGEITDLGITKLGLYAQQYVNAKQQIAEYGNAIKALGDMYKNGSYSLDEYNKKLAEFQSAQRDAAISSNEARKAILEFNKQAIEAEIDNMKELIDAKKEALDAERDLYEYRKSIADKQASIQSLEKKIATLSLSDAREDRAMRLELEEQLAKEKEELAELQRKHALEKQKDALDQEYDNFEKEKKDELDELESNLDKQNEVIERYLNMIQDNYDIIYNNIMTISDEFGIDFTDSLTSPWESATNAAQLYAQTVGEVIAQIEIDSSKLKDLVGNSMGSTWAGESEDGESQKQWVQDKNTNNSTYDKWWYKTSGTVNGEHTYSTGWEQIDDKWYNFGDDG